MKKTNPNFLNGVPELLILRLVSEEKMYGYQIVKRIQERTAGKLSFGEGSIYPILHNLTRKKQLIQQRETQDGRSRIYYQLSPSGAQQLRELQGSWETTTQGIAQVLQPKGLTALG